ncbi:MAG: tetraacyldisaccharide 4'-kinase [Parachlamydiaceae bacterium]
MEKYFLKVITGKEKGVIPSFIRGILWLLSWPFRCVIACRNWVFDKGWVCRYFPPVPVVISIGNIVVGGTGKTPVTLMIAEEFYKEFFIAVLSRGYRSQAEKLPIPIVLCKGDGPMQSASFCGDEPFLIAQNLPKSFVVVGKNRHKASDIAAKAGAHIILLDDGMQHRQLARDFEVVVMDAADPFGQGHFLPRGLLRESVKSLSRANLIILNHVADEASFMKIKKQLANYSKASIIGTKMEVVRFETLEGEPVESIKGKKVGIFCGIANPEYFEKTVQQEGGVIVDKALTGDHKSFDARFLIDFASRCKASGAEILLCTEKDRVKILDIKVPSLPIAWVKMRLNLTHGQNEWTLFMEGIKTDLRRRV